MRRVKPKPVLCGGVAHKDCAAAITNAPPRRVEDGQHPEHTCQRCYRPNVWSWSAPSPLWNAVMRDPVTLVDRYGIICPPCFADVADETGVVPRERYTWTFRPDDMNVVPLWADRDGRVWDETVGRWVAS